MKLVKRNTILILVIILLILLICMLFLLMISEPQNGRKFTIHIIDTIVLQADPPKKKLINYMETKYGRKFTQVNVEPSLYSLERRHHDWGSGNWDYWYNGITVTTNDGSGEYYHVRDNYGTYLDNYGCYLINDDVETELNKKISSALHDKEVKTACFPKDLQYNELSAHMTVQEYLDNVSYCVCIVICGKGDDAQNDYDAICKALNTESGNGWMSIIYFSKNVYENIDMNNLQAIINKESYNMKLKYDSNTSEPYFVSGSNGE